jgi:RNA polymerase sigma-70 factor (ECF subfamily)
MQLTGVIARDDGEAALVERARHGDREAFARLVSVRSDRVLRIARAILESETDAHDAAQNALVSAWVNLPRLRDLDRFDAWINRILRNECTDILRRRRGTRVVDLSAAETEVGVAAAGDPDARLEATTLQAAFRRLSVDDRTILLLHHLHELPLAEVARQLAIPLGTAKSRLWGARRALERALETER